MSDKALARRSHIALDVELEFKIGQRARSYVITVTTFSAQRNSLRISTWRMIRAPQKFCVQRHNVAAITQHLPRGEVTSLQHHDERQTLSR